MKLKIKSIIFLFVLFPIALHHSLAQETPSKIVQEEESAEVFLEEYTDIFQEKFFEALKQKGIENYDRTINLLLECKELQEDNTTITHELAKAFFLNKQYIPAQQYALEALRREPENYWYLNTLITVLNKQSNSFEMVSSELPVQHQGLKKNLASIYFKNKNHQAALETLKSIEDTNFKDLLAAKIEDATKSNKQVNIDNINQNQRVEVSKEDNPTEQLMAELEELIMARDYVSLEKKSLEAIESFPLQPYFYYAQGLALNKNKKPNAAIEVLQTGLDYIFEENQLSFKIYNELASAYSNVGNESKANEYLSKVKRGI